MTGRRITSRVRHLERRAGVGAGVGAARGCPRCAGGGAPAGVLVVDGETVGSPPLGCPACGRVGLLRRTVVEVDREVLQTLGEGAHP